MPVDCVAFKKQVPCKGSLGNSLVADVEDSWGADIAGGVGVGLL